MPRGLRLPAACLAVACTALTTPLQAEDARDLKPAARIVMDHGPIAYRPGLHLVIRSAEELVARSGTPQRSRDRAAQEEMSAALARLFGVGAIDWDRQMVVGVMTGGGRGDAGSLKFVSFLAQGRTLTVCYTGPAFPDHTCAANSGLALVDRFDGAVRFVCVNAP
jgi:hypothetical protein